MKTKLISIGGAAAALAFLVTCAPSAMRVAGDALSAAADALEPDSAQADGTDGTDGGNAFRHAPSQVDRREGGILDLGTVTAQESAGPSMPSPTPPFTSSPTTVRWVATSATTGPFIVTYLAGTSWWVTSGGKSCAETYADFVESSYGSLVGTLSMENGEPYVPAGESLCVGAAGHPYFDGIDEPSEPFTPKLAWAGYRPY